MQSLQQQPLYTKNYSGHQRVKEFLNHCHLIQYYDVFITEGFDSLISLLEITEEDMIVMNVKRGHRRLIQREIANTKGIPRDRPLVTNKLEEKYSLDMSLFAPEQRKPSNGYNYESTMTGLTSPKSMNSGLGGSNASGHSSSNNSGGPSLNRFVPPAPLSSKATDAISASSNDDNDSFQSDSPGPKRKYQRHPRPDKNAPIKPPSAYIMFSNHSRAELKDQNMTFAELAKVVGDRWKNLDDHEKQMYERKAMSAKDEYMASLENYKLTKEYKKYQDYLKDFKSKQEANLCNAEKARKRFKQKSPGSGSLGDGSSNGNSTGSSGDNTFSDKYINVEGNQKPFDQTNDYQDVENYRHEQNNCLPSPSNHRSDQMMRGMIPVEFTESLDQGQKHPLDTDHLEKYQKRKSPRFQKSLD